MHLLYLTLGVAGGGAVGATLRFAIHEITLALTLPPWVATITVNLIGCVGIGIIFAIVHPVVGSDRPPLNPLLATTLTVGLLGALTTFSTFALDTLHLLRDDRFIVAAAYIGGSVILGLILVRLGIALGIRLWA